MSSPSFAHSADAAWRRAATDGGRGPGAPAGGRGRNETRRWDRTAMRPDHGARQWVRMAMGPDHGARQWRGMPSRAPRRWRGGAMGTSRPTATGPHGDETAQRDRTIVRAMGPDHRTSPWCAQRGATMGRNGGRARCLYRAARVMRGCTGDEVEQEEHDYGSAQRTVTMARRDRIGTGPQGEGERTIARENVFYYHTGCSYVSGVLGMASMGNESNEMIIFWRYRMREPRFRRLR